MIKNHDWANFINNPTVETLDNESQQEPLFNDIQSGIPSEAMQEMGCDV